jgi:hypothetical protein
LIKSRQSGSNLNKGKAWFFVSATQKKKSLFSSDSSLMGWKHRNLGTTRIIHLCLRGDRIGPKIEVLASADMVRLLPSKYIFSSKQPSLSAVTTYTYLLYKQNRLFLNSIFSFYVVLRFLWMKGASTKQRSWL